MCYCLVWFYPDSIHLNIIANINTLKILNERKFTRLLTTKYNKNIKKQRNKIIANKNQVKVFTKQPKIKLYIFCLVCSQNKVIAIVIPVQSLFNNHNFDIYI